MKISLPFSPSPTDRRRGAAPPAPTSSSPMSPIHFPKVIQPNVLVCLTQQAYANYFSILRPGGLLVTDSRYVKLGKKVDARQVELPMYETVMEKIGRPIVFNICMLGAVIGLTKLVRPESIMKVLETQIPRSFLEINRQALELGLKLSEGYSIDREL